MKIKVTIVPRNSSQEVEIKKGSTITDLLRIMKLRPDAFIVIKNDIPVPEDDVLLDNQELRLLQVASGG